MDGGMGGGKTVGDPEGLLRSALEKIVFFECRVSQLETELAAAHDTATRARGDAARAERRALELEQACTGERGARAEADRRAGELHDRVRLLEAERERLLGGLLDRARVSGATGASGEPGPEEGGADLAGFMAELRAEIETLRAFRAEAEAAGFGGGAAAERTREPAPVAASPRHEPAGTVSELATRFERSGRVGLTSRDAERMKDLLATRADRALYERSMDDLGAPDAGRRVRAVRALEALGSRAAAPLLAAALGREESPEVKAAILGALARFKDPFVADVAAHQLADARPAVRVAALEALVAAGGARAQERLAAAVSDESPIVRRRAALLLGLQAGDRAEDALSIALCDADRGVARAAAAALSGRPSARAQGALARGLEHPDASVRRAAGAALSRLSGEPLDADAPAPARRAASRRIAERLAGMDGEELRAAVLRSAAAATAAAERVRATTAARYPAPAPARAGAGAAVLDSPSPPARAGGAGRGEGEASARHAPAVRTAVAVLDAAPAPADAAPELAARVVGELRAALRGCTGEALAAALREPPPRIEAALAALVASGTVAQRGSRWFMS
jgi:HEAT repeat protein